MKPAALLSLLAAVLVLGTGAPLAQAATAVPATGQERAASRDAERPSAAERRAADSEFEREKLDQGAFDEAARDAKGEEGSSRDGGGGSVLRMIFGLVVVLGAIYGIHWLLRKWGASRLQGISGRTGVIDVVATTPLAQGRALHLVRVGEELVLVGATEQSITRIGDVDATVLGSQMGNAGNGEFQAMLTGAMYGRQPGVPAGMGGAGSAKEPFLKRFLDNLRLSTAR